MATDVLMPRLSDSMEEGTVLQWLASVGDEIQRGQPLVEIETDKANMTYEADTDGTLVEILAGEGDTLAIGQPIARIGDPSEQTDGASAAESHDAEQAPPAPEPQPERTEPEPVTTKQGARPATDTQTDGRIKASPVARRMARELGVALQELEGSGPGGRIVKADVEQAATKEPAPSRPEIAEPPPAPEPARQPQAQPAEGQAKGETGVVEPSRTQRTIARRMAESKATAPDFQLSIEVDMGECLALRERLKEIGRPPSVNDMIVKACALALREHPRVNASYRDGKFELYSRINVGIAVATEDSLVVPTVFDADSKSLGEIARQSRELAERVRSQTITPPELSGATFTVSNLGMYGIDQFTAVINPPQAAILAVGAVVQKAAVTADGSIVARPLMTATLGCDHRILYGADGAQFLGRVRELLHQPLFFAL